MIEVNRLQKRFGPKIVLQDLFFQAARGETIALLGPNGAGKTTFLRILASLSRATSGEVRMAGFRLPQQAVLVRKMLGVVTHQPLLYGDLTAEENLHFYGRMYDLRQIRLRAGEVLDLVGLADRRGDLVRTFSRGMQQRLAIGRSLLHDPAILLFDEPYSGLDQEASTMLDSVLRKVASEGRTIVMTSHDLARAQGSASRFDVLSHGKISASTSARDLRGNLPDFYRKALT